VPDLLLAPYLPVTDRVRVGSWELVPFKELEQTDAVQAGGDLARLLRELARALEEAMRLEGDARTATAQARFTGLLVSVLPLAAAALAELGSPAIWGRCSGPRSPPGCSAAPWPSSSRRWP
jgi:hypothetical protein